MGAVNTLTTRSVHSTSTDGWIDRQEQFLQHVRSPYHRGEFSGAAVSEVANHPFCSDRIELQVAVDQSGGVSEAWHHGTSCITSLAAASILCEHIEGKSLAYLKNFSRDDMLALLDIQLTPLRQQCALVAHNALQQILQSQREDQ